MHQALFLRTFEEFSATLPIHQKCQISFGRLRIFLGKSGGIFGLFEGRPEKSEGSFLLQKPASKMFSSFFLSISDVLSYCTALSIHRYHEICAYKRPGNMFYELLKLRRVLTTATKHTCIPEDFFLKKALQKKKESR